MHRGDIWLVNLNPTIGTEIGKTRPCVIVNDDAIGILPLKVIVPALKFLNMERSFNSFKFKCNEN